MDREKLKKGLYLFWLSFISLFLELAIIRWIGVEIRIFAYFRNLALVSCIIGFGIGFSLKKYRLGLPTSLSILTVLAFLVHPSVEVAGLSFKKIPEYLTAFPDFHMWYSTVDISVGKIVLGLAMVILIVSLLTFTFIPFGLLIGEIFEKSENRIRDYSINLFGSLCGTWAFAGASYWNTLPWMWFAASSLGIAFLLKSSSRKMIFSLATIVPLLLLTIEKDKPGEMTFWSPYQKIQFANAAVMTGAGNFVPYSKVNINSVLYMYLLNLSPGVIASHPKVFDAKFAKYYPYDLPYRFIPVPEKVLIVGAGGGNDAAAAIRNGAQKIDAVEIDPVIADIGIRFHPEKPYLDPKVNLVIDDARSYFKKTNEKYDMIVFALLDSHTLTSNFTNVNLDSYVYTVESFSEAKKHLTPDGVISLSFQTERPWLLFKLGRLIEKVFGEKPVIINARSGNFLQGTGGTLFMTGNMTGIRNRLESDAELNSVVGEGIYNDREFEKNAAEYRVDIPSDDWPYLYLQYRRIPTLHLLMLAIMALLALAATRIFFENGKIGPSHFLYLGAGFMLVEVHSISKAALLFGSTWIVNAVIISAILVMILAANLTVIAMKSAVSSLKWWYVGLFAVLCLNYFVPVDRLFIGDYFIRGLIVGAFYSAPLFFAGVIFTTTIREVKNMDTAFSANMIGAAVGGMVENLSYLTGLKSVTLIAIAFYALSFWALSKLRKASNG